MRTWKLGLLGTALLLIVLSVAPMGNAQAAFDSGYEVAGARVINEKVTSLAQQKATIRYWSHEALAAAEPVALLVDNTGQGIEIPAFSNLTVASPSAFTPPGMADPSAAESALRAFAAEGAAADSAAVESPADEMAGTAAVFTAYTVNAWDPAWLTYPHQWVGGFYSDAGSCSATAISKNHVVTAAHCVYNTGNNTWYANKVFVPAYRNGSSPFGTFPTSGCTILTAWKNLSGSFSINSWTQYDLAVCGVAPNERGQLLNDVVGWAGRQWGYGYTRSYFNLGYPWRNTSNTLLTDAGQYLRTCTAESFQRATNVLGMGCSYGKGISGGPWMTAYAPPLVSGYVNSVNSGLVVGQKNLYGIRFTTNNIVPLCNAQGC